MLLAFKKLKSVTLNGYPSFALGKLEDTRHSTLVFEYNFVIYDTETNCGGKKAELVELSAFCHGTSYSFMKFVLPQHDINVHTSNISKFHIVSFENERLLHRNGFALQTVSLPECLSLLSFRLYDDSDNSIIKKSLANRLPNSCLSFSDLRKLYSSTGAGGVAPLLANPP